MLSNENRNQLSEAEAATAFREAATAARGLAQKLVLYERNPDPHAELNIENPAHNVPRVRLLGRPSPPPFFAYDIDTVRDHNSFVSSLGREGKPCR